MPLNLSQIAAAVDAIAPFRLAYEWDNVGLQIGDGGQMVERLLVALELNPGVIEYARDNGCTALLLHHPIIFRPQKSIRSDDPVGMMEYELIREGIGAIVAHTNLDRVLKGTNGALARRLGLRDVRILDPFGLNQQYKLVVFVPTDYSPKIIDAIHRGGGGRIGLYSHCTFRSPGTGSFIPEEGSNPFIGQHGKLQEAGEDRLEAVVNANCLKSVLHEIMQAHPYEEPAYDVYPLHEALPGYGLGVVGTLTERMSLRMLAEHLRQLTGSTNTAYAGQAGRQLKKVAIITGSAGPECRLVNPRVADALITGELTYHNTLDTLTRGVGVITLGHAASEKGFTGMIREELLAQPTLAESGLEILTYEDFAEPLVPVTGPCDANGEKKPAPPKPRRKA